MFHWPSSCRLSVFTTGANLEGMFHSLRCMCACRRGEVTTLNFVYLRFQCHRCPVLRQTLSTCSFLSNKKVNITCGCLWPPAWLSHAFLLNDPYICCCISLPAWPDRGALTRKPTRVPGEASFQHNLRMDKEEIARSTLGSLFMKDYIGA